MMRTRWRLFALGRTQVYLHLGTVIFALYMTLTGHGGMLCCSMASILLHEAAHASVAKAFGRSPQEIELTPLGCLMRLEDEAALSPSRRLMMLCAGPLASFLLCWLCLTAVRLGWLDIHAGRRLFCCNLLLLLGNLLPALPLDGGRILALLLSLRLPGERAQGILRISGTALGMGCIGLNLVLSIRHGGWNLSCAMAGCFLMYAAATGTTTFAMAELRRLMDRKQRLAEKGASPCRWLAVTPDTPLRKAAAQLPRGAYAMVCLVDPVDMHLMAQVSERELLSAYFSQPGQCCRLLLAGEN